MLPASPPGMETMQNSDLDSGFPRRTVVLGAACLLIVSSSAADGQVPSTVPDTVPAELLRHYDVNNAQPRDIAVVVFADTATQPQKDSALAALDGEVVGGIPLDRLGYDGAYVVRMSVPDTAGSTGSGRARRLIGRAPGVKVVLAFGPNTARAARAQARSSAGPAGVPAPPRR